MRKSSRTLVALALILGVAMLLGGAAQSADKQPVVIAVPVGLSGVNSVVAPAVVQSAELAVEELNAKGGIMGRPVKLIPLDDESGPAGAVKAFNTAIRQHKADVIITMETSAARNAGAPIADSATTAFFSTSLCAVGDCVMRLYT